MLRPHQQRSDGADARVVADRQVDLAEQQYEHLGHAEHDERGALDQQVDEVAGRQEQRVLRTWKKIDDRDQAERRPAARRSRRCGPAAARSWRTRRASRQRAQARRRRSPLRRSLPRQPPAPVTSDDTFRQALAGSPRSVDVMAQPSVPLLRPRDGAGSPPLPFRRRGGLEAPVVMMSTTDWRSNSAAGPAPPACPDTAPPSGRRPGTRRSGCARSRSRRARGLRKPARSGSSTSSVCADAQRGGRLVHDDELGFEHDRLGHGDRLPLAAGQRAHRLPDRPHRRHGAGPRASASPSAPSRPRRAAP